MSDSVKNIRANVYLNGKNATGTLREMETQTRKLRNELARIPKESKRFQEAKAEFQQLRGEIRKTKDDIYGANQGMNRFKTDMTSNLKSMIGLVATFSTAVAGVRASINYQKELSDLRADVQKTTDLSVDELDIFQDRLDSLDTRTSREELLKLAAQAGKLGVRGVEDLEKFVEQADKINVALGDDLGEDAVLAIGKLADVFETEMITIGNGINKIADSSKAAAPFLTEFLSRLGGSAKSAGIGASDILGYGAALDELGLKVEMSSTALSGFFIDFVKDTEKYGKAAGFANGELSKLVGEQGTNAGFVAFLERLKQANPESDKFLQKLEDLGINGDRGAQVFLALSQNLDKVKTLQGLATEEMANGDSILQEFLKRNTNFAATLEKIQKWLRKTFLDSAFSKGVVNLITHLAKMLGIIEDTDGSAKRWGERLLFIGKLLIVATTATLSYQAALKLVALWGQRAAAAETLRNIALKANALWTSLVVTAQATYITGTSLLTGKITLATAAQRLWNIAMYTSPLGWIAGLVAAATTAYFLFREEQEKGLKIAKLRKEVETDAAKSTADERSRIAGLLAIAKDETQAKEDRLAAIQKLREIAPDYLGDLDLEKIKTGEAQEAIDKYIKSLENKAIAEALQQKRTELYRDLLEKQSSSIDDNVKWYETWTAAILNSVSAGSGVNYLLEKGITNRQDDATAIMAQIDALNKLQAEMVKTGEISVNEDEDPPGGGGGGGDEVTSNADALMAELERELEAKLRHEEDYQKRRKEIIEQYNLSPEDDAALKAAELDRLKQTFDAKIISEEEYLAAVDAVNENYHKKALEREEQKRKDYEQTAEFREEMMRRDAAISAFNAAANAQSAAEAKNAVLNNIRAQIQAYLAKAIAGAIATEFATKGLLGAVTGALAGGAVGVLFNQLVPRFNTGGYTSGGAMMPDPFVPGRKIAGITHDNEYVVASEELKNPATNKLVQAIESVRQGRLRGYGAPTGSSTTVSRTETVNVDPLAGVVAVLAEELKQLRQGGIVAIADQRFRRDLQEMQSKDEFIKNKSEL